MTTARDEDTTGVFDAAARWRAEIITDFRLREAERCAAASPTPGFPQLLDSLMSALDRTGVWLDIGGGLGGIASWIERTERRRVIVLDPSVDSVAAAHRLFPTLAVGVADGEHLPIADNSAAVVIISGVVSLLSHLDGLFAEVRRVLAPNGRVAVVDVWSTTADTFTAGRNTFRSLEDFTQLCDTHAFTGLHTAIGELSTGWWSAAADQVNEEIIARHAGDDGFDQWFADTRHLAAIFEDDKVLPAGIVLGLSRP